MQKRIKYIDETTKQVSVMSANSSMVWATKNGYSSELYEVEAVYIDDNYLTCYFYLKGHAPTDEQTIINN